MFLNAPEVSPHGLLALLIVGIIVIPSITAIRQWVLRHRTQSAASVVSDCSLVGAVALFVASSGMILWTTIDEIQKRRIYQDNELLVEMAVITPKFLKLFFINEIFYTVQLWLLKTSFLGYFFGLRNHFSRKVNVLFLVALFYSAAGFIAVIIVQFLWCRPISTNWSITNNCTALLTVFGITLQSWLNISADLLILIIALIAIYSINLGHTERYVLCFIALIGCVPICLTTVRFVLSYEAARAPATDKGGLAFTRTAIAWGYVEIFFTVVAFCMPSFRVFIRNTKRHSQNRHLDSSGYSGYTSGTYRSSYQTTGSLAPDHIKVQETFDVDFERNSALSQIGLNTWRIPEWDSRKSPTSSRHSPVIHL